MLAIAIFILAVKGIQTVCSPFVFTVYDVPHCRLIYRQWGYFRLEDNQKDIENIISLPLTVKNNYLTWINKHGTLIYTNMFYTVLPDRTNFKFCTNTTGGYMWGSIGFM